MIVLKGGKKRKLFLMTSDVGANIFQKYLIPEESRLIRFCMQKAGLYSESPYFFYAHFVSVGFAVVAVAMSFFNIISYILQIPLKLILRVVQFDPFGIVTGLMTDASQVMKSIVFVSLGATFITAGLLFPKPIFTHFAPEYYETLEIRLQKEKTLLQKKIVSLEEEYKHLMHMMEKTSILIKKQERDIDNLKLTLKQKPRFWKSLLKV